MQYNPKFSGLLPQILQLVPAGLQFVGQQQQHSGQGGNQSPCLEHSVECLDQMIEAYNQGMAAAQSVQEQITLINNFLAALRNPSIFRQNQNDAYLQNTIRQLTAKLQDIENSTAVTASGQVVTTPNTITTARTITATAAPAQLINGIPNTYLAIGAFGLLAIYVFRKSA